MKLSWGLNEIMQWKAQCNTLKRLWELWDIKERVGSLSPLYTACDIIRINYHLRSHSRCFWHVLRNMAKSPFQGPHIKNCTLRGTSIQLLKSQGSPQQPQLNEDSAEVCVGFPKIWSKAKIHFVFQMSASRGESISRPWQISLQR